MVGVREPLRLVVAVEDGSLRLRVSDTSGKLREVSLSPRYLQRDSEGSLHVHSYAGLRTCPTCKKQVDRAECTAIREVLAPKDLHARLKGLVAAHLQDVLVVSDGDRLQLSGLASRVAAAHAYLSLAASAWPRLSRPLHRCVDVDGRPPLALVGGLDQGRFELRGYGADGALGPVNLNARLLRRDNNNEWHVGSVPSGQIACHVQATSSEELLEALRLTPASATVSVLRHGSTATVRAAARGEGEAVALASVLEYVALLRIVVAYVGMLAAQRGDMATTCQGDHVAVAPPALRR